MLSKNPRDCDYLPQFLHDCLVKRLLIQLQRNRIVVVLYRIIIHKYVSVFSIKRNNQFDSYRFIFLAPFASLGDIQVWIQAIKVGQDWRFHDGSPLTGAFPIGMSNGSNELHLRCRSDNNFSCIDTSGYSNLHYMCEYYRQFI